MPVKNILKSLLHLFLPHQCCGCGNDIISEQQLLCLQCIENLPVTNFHLHAGNPVEKIFRGRLPLNNAAGYLYFTKDSLLQNLIHQLKYKGNKTVGHYFGKQIGNAIQQSHRFKDIDALVPLPLFVSRKRKRGYNQATVICNGIAEVLKIPVLDKTVIRKKATETQTRKNRLERWQNMEGMFAILNRDTLNNKHILLVDDVVTTGATLDACGQAMMEAANIQLSIFTLAYTLK